MDCMEYMDQVVGNILGNIFKGFQKRNFKTDVTFSKMSVALVFFLLETYEREKSGEWGSGNICKDENLRIRL